LREKLVLDLSKKILIVDDMATIQQLLLRQLVEIGFKKENLSLAKDGLDALKLLLSAHKDNEPFDLIICDWNMPNMTGLEFLKTIRSTSQHKIVPFLMVTAEDHAQQVEEAFKQGVSEYIIKPVETHNLQEKLEKIFII
jgi:two-component system, chemotaxis family, chemotaxis protein CheY